MHDGFDGSLPESVPSALLGPYALLMPIGSGGAGEVYVALDRVHRLPVAVKVLKALEQGIPDKVLKRFQAEVSVLFRLRHPGVVSALDAGLQHGRFYLVMELCQGPSLQAVLNSVPHLPLPQVLWLARQLAASLDYIHEQGVVHRDIKPSNLLVLDDGLKLTDFGIVHQEGQKLTQTGDAVGTPQFMSPEQIVGGPIDHRSDVFAAALVLYRCLVGKLPFEGTHISVMYHLVNSDCPPPSSVRPELPPGLDAVFATALARDREQRFFSVVELLGALQDALPGVKPTPVVLPQSLQQALASRAALLTEKLTQALAQLPPEPLQDPEDAPTQYDAPGPLSSPPGAGGGANSPKESAQSSPKPGATGTTRAREDVRAQQPVVLPPPPDFPEEITDPGHAKAPSMPPSAVPELGVWQPQALETPPNPVQSPAGRPDIWEMPSAPGGSSTLATTPGNPWERAALAEKAHTERMKGGAAHPPPQPESGKAGRWPWKLLLVGGVAFGLGLAKLLLDEGTVNFGLTRPPLRILPEAPAEEAEGNPAKGQADAAGAPSTRTAPGSTGSQEDSESTPAGAPPDTALIQKSGARDAKRRSGVEVSSAPTGPTGFLRVKTTPAGKVLVDGAQKGTASGARIPLQVGSHTLTLKPLGTGKPVVREIEIREGRTIQLEYDFIERAWRVPAGGP